MVLSPRPWMGKAAPPKGYREMQMDYAKSAALMLPAAAEL